MVEAEQLAANLVRHPDTDVKRIYYELASKDGIDDADTVFELVVENLTKKHSNLATKIRGKIATAKSVYTAALDLYTKQAPGHKRIMDKIASGQQLSDFDLRSLDELANQAVAAVTSSSDMRTALIIIAESPPKKLSAPATPEAPEAPTGRRRRFVSPEVNREINRKNAKDVGSLIILLGWLAAGVVFVKSCIKLPQPPQKEPQQNSAPAEGVKGSMLQMPHGKFARAALERKQPSRNIGNAARGFRGRVARHPTQIGPTGRPARLPQKRPGR